MTEKTKNILIIVVIAIGLLQVANFFRNKINKQKSSNPSEFDQLIKETKKDLKNSNSEWDKKVYEAIKDLDKK